MRSSSATKRPLKLTEEQKVWGHKDRIRHMKRDNRQNRDRKKRLHAVITSGATSEDIMDERCRRRLSPFVQRAFYTLNPAVEFKGNWHIDLICEYLEAIYMDQLDKLIINIAPRSLKSIIASVAYPAWLLGKNPSEHILCASYVAPLATDLSTKCRRVLQSTWYQRIFPGTRFAPDQNEKNKYETTKSGYRVSTTVGGSPMGFGGYYRILDDPIDPEGTMSEAELKSTTDWLDGTWPSRSDDPKNDKELAIMQRLHVDDPTGHLMRTGQYELLKIPMEAPTSIVVKFPLSGKEIKREQGELMHPERFGPEQAEKEKKKTYVWAGQYQQEPFPVGGGRIKLAWFPRYRQQPSEFDELVGSVDTGGKGKSTSNPTAVLIFGRRDNQWYLLQIIKDKLSYPELYRRILAADDKYGGCDSWLIEDKAQGQSLIEDFREKTTLPVIPIEPKGEKPVRMETQLPSLEAGLIALPDQEHLHAPWMSDLETNLGAFPSPSEWDEIDSLSQFLKWIRKRDKQHKSVGIAPVSMTGTSSWKM